MFYFLNACLAWLLNLNAGKSQNATATFEVFKDREGEYRFRLKATNGQIILASEGYTTKANAKKGIASVKRHAVIDACYERKSTKSGLAMFNLKATNHEIIGTSESYVSVTSRDRGIASVKRNAPNATVIDLT